MNPRRRDVLAAVPALGLAAAAVRAADAPRIEVTTPMAPPAWALLQRAVFDAHTAACDAFFARYFDERGWLLARERWGGDDGPDDAIENVNDWPLAYALGADERLRVAAERAYEGHVRQYTLAHTTEVPLARAGMYFREFPVMMDWQHNGEGLTAFNVMGLGDPYNPRWRDRVRRFAGFYTGEDASAPNYDPRHRLIRSMFNGSRGPLMRRATAQDWAGDPIDTAGLEQSVHGEADYRQMLAHFADYTETEGDTPINLVATGLGVNAFMLSGEAKYRDWVLAYVDAWAERARANHDILPSNIGLDGTIGGAAGGKWYGGCYGWGFSPVVPMTGRREDRNRVPRAFLGFANAYLLTGDDQYLDVWRRMTDRINAAARPVDGKLAAPRMYGDEGWYSFGPGLWNHAAQDLYLLSMKPADRARAPDHPWLLFLDGRNPAYPETALTAALSQIRAAHAKTLADTSTPDTRFADTVLDQNPAAVTALAELTVGGVHIGRPGWSPLSPNVGGALFFAALRWFDADRHRAGLPADVAALVERVTAETATLTLVNCNQNEWRTAICQGGGYGEHRIVTASVDGRVYPVAGRTVTIALAPGAGARVTLTMKRHANAPTLDLPWGGPAGVA